MTTGTKDQSVPKTLDGARRRSYNPAEMGPPPDFNAIADQSVKSAFLNGHPEMVLWLTPGTRLFKWTKSVATRHGISPWWQFVDSTRLATGSAVPGIQELQMRAGRLGAANRDFARMRLAVTEQWNKMTELVAIALQKGAWGYVGKAAGQLKDQNDPKVFFIGGEYQVWIPGLTANDIRRISILPFLQPNTPFRKT